MKTISFSEASALTWLSHNPDYVEVWEGKIMPKLGKEARRIAKRLIKEMQQ
jgi:hypothetical protein